MIWSKPERKGNVSQCSESSLGHHVLRLQCFSFISSSSRHEHLLGSCAAALKVNSLFVQIVMLCNRDFSLGVTGAWHTPLSPVTADRDESRC